VTEPTDYFKYNDPLIIIHRTGTEDDPYNERTDEYKIINNIIVLYEIPDKFNKVQIENYYEVFEDQEILSNNFKVDYSNGMVSFNPSEEGKTISARIFGRGIILYPASRIYLYGTDNAVLNLQDLIDINNQTIDVSLVEIESALTSMNNLSTSVSSAEVVRVGNENTRISNEDVRISNEQDRIAKINNLINLGNYNDATNYLQNNIVSYLGSGYMCILSSQGNLPTNTTYWKLISSKGDKGDTGEQGIQGIQGIQGEQGLKGDIGINWLGNYDNLITYNINDGVFYQGSSYICIQESTGNIPTKLDNLYWDLIAENGSNGVSEWDDIQNKPTFATVATTGSYNDLLDKPSSSSANMVIEDGMADWNSNGVEFVLQNYYTDISSVSTNIIGNVSKFTKAVSLIATLIQENVGGIDYYSKIQIYPFGEVLPINVDGLKICMSMVGRGMVERS